MLLEEFREALAALPSYAPVEARDEEGSRVPVGAVDYFDGKIRVFVDDVVFVSVDDEDEDEDADFDTGADDEGETLPRPFVDEYLSTFRHRAKLFGIGCACDYPLCCVLFFVLVWIPIVRSIPPPLADPVRGVRGWMHAMARRFRAFWIPGPVEYIPCPWHRCRGVKTTHAAPSPNAQAE
jgi:hypothetical protein